MDQAESTAESGPQANVADVVTLADTAEEFLAHKFPEKEPLIEHLLHRRDLVALGARRRHGKTTLLTNMSVAMAIPVPEFLGYRIPERRRTLMLALEDDPGEYQNFLRAFVGNNNLHRAMRVMTREHFHDADVQIDATNGLFQELVFSEAMAHRADNVVFDNLAHIVNADYNDSKKIHTAMKFVYRLAADVNCAAIIAAHPRKDQSDDRISLEADRNYFFESIMGSSMFINTTGSLWGLERRDDVSVFVGGRQRSEGTDSITYIQRDERGWLQLVDAASVNLPNVLNTPSRQLAWRSLPPPGTPFSYTEGEMIVAHVLKSKSTFAEWMKQCRRMRVIVDTPCGRLAKAQGCN